VEGVSPQTQAFHCFTQGYPSAQNVCVRVRLPTRILKEPYKEMAHDLKRHVKSIDNALQRIKLKIEHKLAGIELP
jgi:hypothetical protein